LLLYVFAVRLRWSPAILPDYAASLVADMWMT